MITLTTEMPIFPKQEESFGFKQKKGSKDLEFF